MNESKHPRRPWLGALVVVLGGAGLAIPLSLSRQPPAPAITARAQPAAGGDQVARAHGATDDLPASVAEALDRLRSRLASQPDDLSARKELAVRLVEHGRMMEAFEEARKVLALAPDDPDGLYVEGEVRVAMGQWDRAIGQLDRVLARYPDHLMALIARGRAYSGTGRVDEALADWNHGLRLVGGQYPPIERLIASAGAGGQTRVPPPADGSPVPPSIGLVPAHGSGAATAPVANPSP